MSQNEQKPCASGKAETQNPLIMLVFNKLHDEKAPLKIILPRVNTII